MKEFERAREEYEAVLIPEELGGRIRTGICQGRRKRAARLRRRWAGGAAACLALGVGTLNLSPTAAAAAAEAPVLGGLFQVLTVRDFSRENGDRTLNVTQPVVTGTDFAERVNQEIREKVDAKTAEAEQLVAEYKDAFLSTGGTEAQWAEHDIRITVDYKVVTQTKDAVSFYVESDVSFANAYRERTYYNLDENGEVTLADVLGEDWQSVCDKAVQAAVAAAPEAYFPAGESGFAGVDETTSFYLTESGGVTLVFPPYTLAPGAFGYVSVSVA